MVKNMKIMKVDEFLNYLNDQIYFLEGIRDDIKKGDLEPPSSMLRRRLDYKPLGLWFSKFIKIVKEEK